MGPKIAHRSKIQNMNEGNEYTAFQSGHPSISHNLQSHHQAQDQLHNQVNAYMPHKMFPMQHAMMPNNDKIRLPPNPYMMHPPFHMPTVPGIQPMRNPIRMPIPHPQMIPSQVPPMMMPSHMIMHPQMNPHPVPKSMIQMGFNPRQIPITKAAQNPRENHFRLPASNPDIRGTTIKENRHNQQFAQSMSRSPSREGVIGMRTHIKTPSNWGLSRLATPTEVRGVLTTIERYHLNPSKSKSNLNLDYDTHSFQEYKSMKARDQNMKLPRGLGPSGNEIWKLEVYLLNLGGKKK
jgi:hypothetical protein